MRTTLFTITSNDEPPPRASQRGSSRPLLLEIVSQQFDDQTGERARVLLRGLLGLGLQFLVDPNCQRFGLHRHTIHLWNTATCSTCAASLNWGSRGGVWTPYAAPASASRGPRHDPFRSRAAAHSDDRRCRRGARAALASKTPPPKAVFGAGFYRSERGSDYSPLALQIRARTFSLVGSQPRSRSRCKTRLGRRTAERRSGLQTCQSPRSSACKGQLGITIQISLPATRLSNLKLLVSGAIWNQPIGYGVLSADGPSSKGRTMKLMNQALCKRCGHGMETVRKSRRSDASRVWSPSFVLTAARRTAL